MKLVALVVSLLLSTSAFASGARVPVRIDARTAETAELTYGQMIREATPETQQLLRVAVIRIGLENATDVQQVQTTPALQTLSIVSIKDKVAGMTAAELIARGVRGNVNVRFRP